MSGARADRRQHCVRNIRTRQNNRRSDTVVMLCIRTSNFEENWHVLINSNYCR